MVFGPELLFVSSPICIPPTFPTLVERQILATGLPLLYTTFLERRGETFIGVFSTQIHTYLCLLVISLTAAQSIIMWEQLFQYPNSSSVCKIVLDFQISDNIPCESFFHLINIWINWILNHKMISTDQGHTMLSWCWWGGQWAIARWAIHWVQTAALSTVGGLLCRALQQHCSSWRWILCLLAITFTFTQAATTATNPGQSPSAATKVDVKRYTRQVPSCIWNKGAWLQRSSLTGGFRDLC